MAEKTVTMSDAEGGSEPTLTDVLELEELDRDLYRANLVYSDEYSLYGGQVAAQALRAAGLTVPADRTPHSLHSYFLRAGDASRPTIFRVDRDRDGRSYSARRVVALQGGEVLFNLSCSFSVAEEGLDLLIDPVPAAEPPAELPDLVLPRLYSIEARLPTQPGEMGQWPTRFWARATVALPDDPLVHACALTYLSDISTGMSAIPAADSHAGVSLDHAVWFHRPIRLDEWVLVDLVPRAAARGRGWYTGTVHDASGRHGASLTQEMVLRAHRSAPADIGPSVRSPQ